MSLYFLGVDGGQSSTTLLIGDEHGRVLGMGRGGPANLAGGSANTAEFVRTMQVCLQAACAQGGLPRSTIHFAAACLGLSGGPSNQPDILQEILSSDRTIVTDDALIALAGATAGDPGLIVIAGTGSIAFGRNAQGETARAGGWGYAFGDEGSGFWIVRQALRAALRWEEGWGTPTSLRAALLNGAGTQDMNELLHRFYTAEFSRSRIAAFAKLVDAAAEEGDGTAREILHEGAQQLAVLAGAVRRQLFPAGTSARVAYTGGVFGSRILFARFRALVELEEGNQLGPPVYGPAAGALLEAYRDQGIHCALSSVPEEKS